MPKKPTNSGNPWTPEDIRMLKNLAKGNTPTRIIALDMKRTPAAISGQASRQGISLKPVNQAPYNRRPK